MSADKRGLFGQVFVALMIFTGLVWAWTVAFIISWPWEKNGNWQPEFRLVATCADKEPCGLAYKDIDEAKAQGRVLALTPAEPAGDVEEPRNWLHWTTDNGVIEAKASSWHFQTTIRYKVEGDVPVLVAYQDVPARAFFYGVGAALFSLLGIYLRKLRG